jgi:prepilin-type N-terminal cleavage/methylation domain-containing protein
MTMKMNAKKYDAVFPAFRNPPSIFRTLTAFTLIELLTVISIIAVLAAFSIPVVGAIKKKAYLNHASAEMVAIETALDRYKAAYGTYPPGNPNNSLISQLYYELVGTTNIGTALNPVYQTLDGYTNILQTAVTTAFGAGGFINCSKGGGEESIKAQTFLPNLNLNTQVGDNGYGVKLLVTSVGGPLPTYQAGILPVGVNPWRYVCPGTNNPNSYDLWVQIVIKPGQTNLICNWSGKTLINNPLP